MKKMLNNIDEFVSLPEDALADLTRCLQQQTFSKKEIIIQKGEPCSRLFFVESGAVRSYQCRNAREVTTWIYFPEMYFTAWDSFLHQNPNDETFEAVADTVLVSVPYEDMQHLFRQHTSLAVWGRKLMEQYTVYFNRFNQQMRFATAEQKYDFYLHHFPDQPKVKLGHIASFLGISQETLSRLRRNKNVPIRR